MLVLVEISCVETWLGGAPTEVIVVEDSGVGVVLDLLVGYMAPG